MSASNSMTQNTSTRIHKMVVVAMLCALAYLCVFIFHFKISFLTFDAKDAILTLAAFLYGPLAGVVASLVVSFVEFFTISDTGVYGFLMNFASSAVFAGVAGLIYRYRHTLSGAILGLAAAVVSMTAVMLIMNLIITPYYMHCSMQDVVALIPTLLLPFNLMKAIMNAALTYLLYRPVRSALHASGLLPHTEHPAASRVASALAIVIALVLIVAVVCCYIFVLNGSFQLFRA